VNHIEVDPDEIRMREEARAHKAKQKQKQKRFLDLSTAGDFSSYGKALELTGWMGQLSRGRDEMYFRQPEFNFLPFLANDEVFNFAAQNGGVGPFRLMDLMKEAYRRKNDEILLLLLKKIFDIDRYLPAMDAAAFIENNLIEVALPVLKQYSAHPANEARRAIGRAIDAIELKSGHEALLQNTNIESYERAIKLWVEFSERWGQRTRPVDKALLSSRLASFLSDPQVVERAAADVDGSPFELAQLANAAKDHGLYGIAAVLAKAVRT